MDIRTMTIEDLQSRKAEIAIEVEADGADLDALMEETRAINEELESRKAEEAKKVELRKLVASNDAANVIEEAPKTEERKTMTNNEMRKSKEYGEAFLRGLKMNDYSECRALLTEMVEGGYVPVPTALETEIKTAWEEHKLMNLVSKSNFKGNIKIGFELSATGASIHVEGANAPNEEVVTIGTVTITNQTIKKWIRVSDEALKGTTVDTAGYLYREIAYRIVEKAEEVLIGVIEDTPEDATSTTVGIPVYEVETIAADTIVQAEALLAGAAQNLYLVMNRATYPAFRALELAGNYAFDVFEGLRDRIIFTDKLDSFAEAEGTFALLGDFKAVQANFPNGEGIEMIIDPYTDAEADLVKIVGKQMVGIGVVKDRHIVKLAKASENDDSQT